MFGEVFVKQKIFLLQNSFIAAS